MQKNKKVIITSVVALAVASCVILTSFALKSNSVSADNVGNELSINDESIEMIFEELEKIKTLIKSGDNTLGFGDTEEALYLYELALSGLAELELSYIEEPNSEIINEIETIAKELTYKIEEVKNSLESEEVIPENNSVNDTSSESSTEISTTSTNTTTSNTNTTTSNTNTSTSTNTNTNTNTNSNSSSANTSTSTSGSTNNNSSNSSISTPTETTTTSDSSNSNSNNSNTSSDNTNSNNSSNSTSTPNNNTTSSTPQNGQVSEDGTKTWLDGFGWVDGNINNSTQTVDVWDFELSGNVVGH